MKSKENKDRKREFLVGFFVGLIIVGLVAAVLLLILNF